MTRTVHVKYGGQVLEMDYEVSKSQVFSDLWLWKKCLGSERVCPCPDEHKMPRTPESG